MHIDFDGAAIQADKSKVEGSEGHLEPVIDFPAIVRKLITGSMSGQRLVRLRKLNERRRSTGGSTRASVQVIGFAGRTVNIGWR